MVDIAAVSYLLSSIASTGKIIEFAMGIKRDITNAEIETAKSDAKFYAEQKLKTSSVKEIADSFSFMMTDEIIEEIRRSIDEAGDEIIEAIGDYKTLPQTVVDQKLASARRRYCWSIHQVKFHNRGTLPPDLQEHWDRNLCGTYNFT
jgi:hypothetical protein